MGDDRAGSTMDGGRAVDARARGTAEDAAPAMDDGGTVSTSIESVTRSSEGRMRAERRVNGKSGDIRRATGEPEDAARGGRAARGANGSKEVKKTLVRTNTPGKGLPWSPRSAENGARDAAVARARRSDRKSDADAIARFIDDELDESTSDDVYAPKAVFASSVPEKSVAVAAPPTKRSPWAALVSYLRCCVAANSSSDIEFELAKDGRTNNAREIRTYRDLRATCIPCVGDDASGVCVPSGYVMHQGPPFIEEQDCEWDEVRWRAHASEADDAVNLPSTPPRYKPCLVLDLDETLVHSSFKPVPNSNFIVPVEIDGSMTDVYVIKRPWVDHFLREVAKDWEIVVFTASVPKYANPVLDLLDTTKVVRWRLFRKHCYAFQGNYVKDLTCLGRDLKQTVIVDNSPYSYVFHPQNAFPVTSFIDDPNDNELLNAIPYLRELARSSDVRDGLKRMRSVSHRKSYFGRKGIDAPTLDRFGIPVAQ